MEEDICCADLPPSQRHLAALVMSIVIRPIFNEISCLSIYIAFVYNVNTISP